MALWLPAHLQAAHAPSAEPSHHLNLVTKPPPALRCSSAYAFPLWGGLLKDAYSLTQGQLQAIASTANVAGSVCVRRGFWGEQAGERDTLGRCTKHAAVQPTTSPMLQLSPSPAALQGHRGGAGI